MEKKELKEKLGGGGSGCAYNDEGYHNTTISGSGSDGTSYSGGTGGGGATTGYNAATAENAYKNGRNGGSANGSKFPNKGYRTAGGGAGNPYGLGWYGNNGSNGTGGLLIIKSNEFYNAGNIYSIGANGGNAKASGGSSGGGSINIFYSSIFDINGRLQANGGTSGNGGAGGDGSVTVGNISTGTFVKQEIQENP